ncbi:MAG: T9SS type A sorting domain-containing protein [Saprospiraceae bacterium]|nr:T9SS type A sorting domain-containing protein [Saprospiraceae bacterium]
MKNLIRLGLIIILTDSILNTLQAQPTPYFEMTLYFEDTVGNRDTIIFGYDIDASSDIDPEWGEVELTTPFDSVFEVRIGNANFPYSNKLASKIINSTSIAQNCYYGSGAYLYFHVIHQPVKIWWDKSQLLNDECFSGAFIINHITDVLAGPFSPDEIPPIHYCMAVLDTVYFELTEEALTPDQIRIYINKDVEGLGVISIPGLRFEIGPYWAYTPCYWVTDTESPKNSNQIAIYPNPANGYFKLSDLSGGGVLGPLFIYDSMGRMVKYFTTVESEQLIDVSGLPEGWYHVAVHIENNRIWRGAFVKR